MAKELSMQKVIPEPLALPSNATNILPPVPHHQFMSADKIKELRSLWHQNQWHQQGLEELLFSSYEISDRRQLINLTPQQFERLKSDLANVEIKQEFLSND